MSKLKSTLTIVLFSLFTNLINAQEMSCQEKVQKLFIDKVKHHNSKDLIPYYSEKDNNWGYFNRNTGKIITEPIMRRDAIFFKPNLKFYYSFETNGIENGCTGEISGSKNNYKILSLNNAQYQAYDTAFNGSYEKKSYKNHVKNSINGFEVDENGVLTNFNPKFYDEREDKPLISEVILFKGNIYAITKIVENNKNYFTMIKQNGEEFLNFKKTEYYPRLKQIYSNDTDLWFLTKSKNGKYIYKSLLENKTLQDSFDDDTIYGEKQAQKLGYVIYTVNKKNGVLDLTTMKWKVKPTNKINFSYLEYSSSEKLTEKENIKIIPNKDIEENRKISYIYIQTSNNEFYDLQLKLYKPKK